MRRGFSRRASAARSRPGAVVIGGDYQGLGIVRSLGRHGVPICVIDDELSIARFSRYTTYSLHEDELRDERSTVDALLAAGRRLDLQGWVLYPTRDETVAAISRHREELQEVFRVPTPSWEAIRPAWDKRETNELGARLSIPIPRTWYPRDSSELVEIECEPPFAVKPAIKEHFIYATKAKAWRADSMPELRDLFERAAAIVGPGEVMVQELIPGDGKQQFAYCAFYRDGEPVASMVARRRRQHPPEFGRASTYVETIDLPLLEELSRRFLDAVGYYGLVEVEFKLDPRDGAYKLLDVNPRTWGYHTIGTQAGVDFPYLLYADQTGEAVAECRASPGVRWIRLLTDVPTGFVEIAGRRLDWRTYLRTLGEFDVEAVFSRRDPLPGLVELALVPYLAVKRGF